MLCSVSVNGGAGRWQPGSAVRWTANQCVMVNADVMNQFELIGSDQTGKGPDSLPACTSGRDEIADPHRTLEIPDFPPNIYIDLGHAFADFVQKLGVVHLDRIKMRLRQDHRAVSEQKN